MPEKMADTVKPVIKWTPNKCGPSSLSRKLKNITTPQPFRLSSHECTSKHAFTNCKHEQIKKEMEERQKNIDIESLKQFRANPVPAHTFLPLFEQIQKEKAQKREFEKERVKVQLIAKQKPFNLSCYKEPVRRCQSVSDLSTVAKDKSGEHFRASPLPKYHNGKPLLEIMAEQEILREIRLRRRAEQLIKSSALPFSVPRDAIKKHKLAEAATKERVIRSVPITPKQKSQRCIRQNTLRFETPPDADKTPRKSRTKDCCKELALKSNEIMHWRRSASVSALDCSTPRMTYSAILREQANRERWKENPEIRHLPAEKQRELLKMKRDLLTKITHNQPSMANEERLCRYREDTQARMKEYHQEMQKMAERVKARPFLVERQSQLSAVHKLDKTFRELLLRQGLDEDFILAHSKPFHVRHSTSDESGSESSSFEAGDAEGTRDKGHNTPSVSSNYSTDANTDDRSHHEEEETSGNGSDEVSDSETELPERDFS